MYVNELRTIEEMMNIILLNNDIEPELSLRVNENIYHLVELCHQRRGEHKADISFIFF